MINRDYDYIIELENKERYVISKNKYQENWIGYCESISTNAPLNRSVSDRAFDDGGIVSQQANFSSRTTSIGVFLPDADHESRALVSHRAMEMSTMLVNHTGRLIWRESDGIEREWGPIVMTSAINIDTNDQGPKVRYLISLISENPYIEWTQYHSFAGLVPSDDPHDCKANFGNCYAYPEMTVFGPCTSFKIENYNTGEYLEINRTLSASDRVDIYTEPGKRSVMLNGNTDIFSDLVFQIQGTAPSETHNTQDSYIGYNADYLQFVSKFWSFQPRKPASVKFTAVGSTEDTTLDLTYTPSWIY